MEKNLQTFLDALRRELGPIKALILAELFASIALALWINSGAVHRSSAFFLINLFLTLAQPKTQFALVWGWQDKMKELSGAACEAVRQGIGDLETLRKEGMDELRVYLMISPVFLLLELGVSGEIAFAPGILFGVFSYLIFEIWQRRYRKALSAFPQETYIS